MKKNIINTLAIFVMFALVLSSCDKTENVRKGFYEHELISTSWVACPSIVTVDYFISEIHYKVFVHPQGGVFVLNITKDSLYIVDKLSLNKTE